MSGPDLPIAVVGAGFSGTMTALHLLPRTAPRAILLCERGERFARGTAYGTDDPGHLLNVRASNMSAFPDRPDDFTRWLVEGRFAASPQVRTTPAGTFVSRHLYGRYLASLLGQVVAEPHGASRLILVPDEVVDLVSDGDGDGFRLVLAGGRQHNVAGAVLAAGNFLPVRSEVGPYVANPWACCFTEGLHPREAVVVVGSGLTMVDVTLQLRHAGFAGAVIAISRRGLAPRSHAATAPWPTPALTPEEQGSPAHLLRRLRREARAAEAAGAGWRSVVDSLRPITSALWQSFGHDGQRRFLRHARPWWDSHRHRMAVPVGAAVDDLVRRGLLDVRAGRIEEIVTEPGGARVTYRPRAQGAVKVVTAQRVINATGAIAPDQCGNALLERLLDRGLARLDSHGLGLDLTPDFAVIGASGRPVPGLWALGPLAMGVLWECTAVPDIREHAALVARHVAAALPAGAG